MKIENITWALAAIFIVFIVFILVDPNGAFEASTIKIELVISTAIGYFATIQGVTSYSQMKSEKTRLQVEDLRNELEKVYAPIYSIVYSMDRIERGTDDPSAKPRVVYDFRNDEDREKLSSIFFNYPHVLSDNLREIWQNDLCDLTTKTDPDFMEIPEKLYDELWDVIIEEYYDKIDSYDKLLGKRPTNRKPK